MLMRQVGFFLLLIGAATLLASTPARADSGDKLAKAIQTRQGAYKYLAWNMGKIKRMLENDALLYDAGKAKAAANAISAFANSGIGALFLPGTDKTVNGVKTNAKPEMFQAEHRQKLGDVAADFNREANKLAKVAAQEDEDELKAQFGKVGKTCKACHKAFKHKR